MKLCDVGFCNFVVWKKDELIVMHIHKDEGFIRNATEKATYFYKQCVLPELLGRWHTTSALTESQ